ncbi:MAG: glycosyltransferase [Bacteroidetes bacterium]|nr:glycosyltransferase [Bacteroidota bacterium]MDF1866702.1 glycosyltransferase [Saprospiraceae bacterium]
MSKKSSNNSLPNILMISSERYPHHDTNTQQVIKNATAMSEVGVPLELIIPVQKRNFFDWTYDLPEAVYKYYNVSKSLKISPLKNIVPASDLRLEKFFHSFVATIYAVLFRRNDIVYTRNKLAAFLCILLGKKFIFETYRRLGDDSPKTMKWFSKRAHKDSFVGMVLHSHVSKNSMLKAGIPEEKLLVLHNGFDESDMQPRLTQLEARQKLGLDPESKYIVYTGNMQENKCIESLIDIAESVPDAQFLLVGGREEDINRLKAYAKSKELKNVILPGRVPIAMVSTYLFAGDLLIIPPVSAPLEKFGRTVLPFKIFPYLAAGRVIIAPNLADMKELLVHEKNAILVEPDNPSQNAEAIRDTLSDPIFCKKIGEESRETSMSLTWKARGLKFKKWFEGLDL